MGQINLAGIVGSVGKYEYCYNKLQLLEMLQNI